MKNAVVTISIGEFHERLALTTHPQIRAYADKIGADFIVLKSTGLPIICYEKFQIRDLLDKYDRVFYIDSDVIVSPETPNIFELVPREMMGFLDESPLGYDQDFIEFLREYGRKFLSSWTMHRKCYNAGVFVCSREHREVFKLPEKLIKHHEDQSYLNLRLLEESTPIFELPYQYNRMIYLDLVVKEHRLKSYIVHYAGFLEGRPIEECEKFLKKEYEMLVSQDFSKDDVKIGWATIT